jgi:hypothetical protein
MCIWNVEMRCHGSRRIFLVGVTEFDDIRIADGNLGVHDGTVRTWYAHAFDGLEGKDEEVEELWSALDEEVGRDVVETRTAKMGGSG